MLPASSRERLSILEREVADLREQSSGMKAHWQQEKDAIQKIRGFKARHEALGEQLVDPAALAERHAVLRAESLALLATITEADLDRTARHAELGPVSLRELLNEWAAHDLMHVVQAERAVMHPPPTPGLGDRHDPDWRYYHACGA